MHRAWLSAVPLPLLLAIPAAAQPDPAPAPALADSTPCDGIDVVCYDQVGRPGF